MARTVIDIDDDALAEAMRELGTTTKVETVNRALRLVAGASSRAAAQQRIGEVLAGTDLDDPDVMAGAWA
ncbi:MAG: type II toxin-antitoxin system VapB family antitoxin [Sporichthyaceae bacterium]